MGTRQWVYYYPGGKMVLIICLGIIILAFGIFNYVSSMRASKGKPLSADDTELAMRFFAGALALSAVICLWLTRSYALYCGDQTVDTVISIINSIVLLSFPAMLIFGKLDGSLYRLDAKRGGFIIKYLLSVVFSLLVGIVYVSLLYLIASQVEPGNTAYNVMIFIIYGLFAAGFLLFVAMELFLGGFGYCIGKGQDYLKEDNLKYCVLDILAISGYGISLGICGSIVVLAIGGVFGL